MTDIEFGLDSFGDVPTDDTGNLTSYGTAIRAVVDEAILADELAGFGPEVLVLSPPELRDAVIERLQRVEQDHG